MSRLMRWEEKGEGEGEGGRGERALDGMMGDFDAGGREVGRKRMGFNKLADAWCSREQWVGIESETIHAD